VLRAAHRSGTHFLAEELAHQRDRRRGRVRVEPHGCHVGAARAAAHAGVIMHCSGKIASSRPNTVDGERQQRRAPIGPLTRGAYPTNRGAGLYTPR